MIARLPLRIPLASTLAAALLLAAAVAPAHASAQTPTPPPAAQSAQPAAAPSGIYRIAGTVISSTTGQPVPLASVRLRSSQNSAAAPFLQSTTADEYGRFEFTGIPAGNFTLQGEARGFLATYYDDHDGFTTGIITGVALDTGSLILKLVPRAALSGSITNEAGEPVQNASVRLFRQTHSFGDARIVSAGTASTDDLGRFEFPSLAPGDYLVAVTAQPWYAVHPQPSPGDTIRFPTLPADATSQQQEQMRNILASVRRQAVFGVTGPLDPALDVAYPITYYPGGDDPTQALPIPLRPGDAREFTLQLSPVPRSPSPSPTPRPSPTAARTSPSLSSASPSSARHSRSPRRP